MAYWVTAMLCQQHHISCVIEAGRKPCDMIRFPGSRHPSTHRFAESRFGVSADGLPRQKERYPRVGKVGKERKGNNRPVLMKHGETHPHVANYRLPNVNKPSSHKLCRIYIRFAQWNVKRKMNLRSRSLLLQILRNFATMQAPHSDIEEPYPLPG